MNFLNPIVLFGLVAAGIPILLHLLNLRRIKKFEFSSLKFLKELKRSQIRRIKLRQILLLILRTLLIILIVSAFSRPIIKGSLPGFRNYAPTSAVILIDNSPSMSYSDEYGNRFNYAKRLAKKIIDQLHTGDEVAILDMASIHAIEDLSFHSDFKTLNEKVNKIQISYSSANFSRNLNLLPALFENSKNVNKEVFIISDNQKGNFINFDTSKVEKLRPAFYFFNIGQNSKMDISNISIDSLKFITRIFQQNKPVVIQATVRNHSQINRRESNLSLTISGEKVAQRKFDINPNSTLDVEISANLKDERVINGNLELENDALEEDNKRFFGIILPQKPSVGIITESSNPFILAATGHGLSNSYCKSDLLNTSQFNSADLSKYDILLIDSYNNLSISKLSEYIKNGGRAILFASPDLKTNPNLLYDLKISNIQISNSSGGQSGVISRLLKNHPLFEGVFLNSNTSNSPDNVRISQLYKIESGFPIIETTFGNLLTEIKVGDGNILFCGVAPKDEWSNLQSSTLFPVIVYRGILYLSMLPELSKNIDVGETAQIVIPVKFAKGTTFKIVDPNKISSQYIAPSLPSSYIITLNNINMPGNYIIYNTLDEPVGIISANISKDESNLRYMDNRRIEKLLASKYTDKVYVAFIDDFTSLHQKIERVRTGTELWSFLIVLALIVAISELVVQRVMKSEVVED